MVEMSVSLPVFLSLCEHEKIEFDASLGSKCYHNIGVGGLKIGFVSFYGGNSSRWVLV